MTAKSGNLFCAKSIIFLLLLKDDFAKIWSQLSAAGGASAGPQDTPTGRPAQARTHQKGSDRIQGPSLQQAAQALQNLPAENYQRVGLSFLLLNMVIHGYSLHICLCDTFDY